MNLVDSIRAPPVKLRAMIDFPASPPMIKNRYHVIFKICELGKLKVR